MLEDAPDNWERITLGEVAQVRSGYAFKSKDWQDYGVPVVKIANVKNGELVIDGCLSSRRLLP